MKKPFSSLVLAAASLLSLSVAVPAHGASQKTYTNPILNLDYSDPDVVAVGDDFYMTASSFVNTPGLPILHSKDLVNWAIVNYALTDLEPLDQYSTVQHGCGVWAPSIRYHNGEFYIYWGDPDYGIFMVKSSDPLGEWEKPVLVYPAKGIIDTTPLWDDDGKAYMVNGWAASRSGLNAIITVSEMAPDGKSLLEDPVLVYDGTYHGDYTIEGPKFYKRNGYYYILAPAGGVPTGWQVALRSKSPYGPYENKIVMAQGDSDINGPHQGGWVDTPNGESWFINFQDRDYMGRVVHLNPMKWVDDWPVIGEDKDGDGCGEPVRSYRMPIEGQPKYEMQVDDDFNTRELGLQWQWNCNYDMTFGLPSDLGYYRIYGHKLTGEEVNLWKVPNMLTQKFMADDFSATAKVKVVTNADGQESGLIIMGRDYGAITLQRDGENFLLKQLECKNADKGKPQTVETLATLKPTKAYQSGGRFVEEMDIWLRVHVAPGGECQFSYSLDGKKFIPCGKAFKAREGTWIGARVGFISVQPAGKERGWMDLDEFKVTKKK